MFSVLREQQDRAKLRPVFLWEVGTVEDLTLELIASLNIEKYKIHRIQAYLRGDHVMTPKELADELELSFGRRYSLHSTETQVVSR